MSTIVKTLLVFFSLLSATAVASVDIDFYVNREASVISVDEADQKRNAQIAYKVIKRQDAPLLGYEIIVSGVGNYDRFADVNWETISQVDVVDGLIKPRKSTRIIYNADGIQMAAITHEYDYEKGVVNFQRMDDQGEITFAEGYALKGPTCDDTNLAQFVRGIYVAGISNEYRTFYLLSNEPILYRVRTRIIGEEQLDLPGGSVKTVKLQLMADLGPLTALAAQVVGPTYIWLEAEYPHLWLQYQGREAGRDSDIVRTYVANH